MSSVRHDAHIDCTPADAWVVLSDIGGIDAWAPGVDECSADGMTRSVRIGEMELVEEVSPLDGELRRLQYSITQGLPCEHHLATVDVLEDGDGCRVVYAVDVRPDELAPIMDQAAAAMLGGLAAHLQG